MKKLVFGIIAIVVTSFSVNAQDLRANFLKGKDHNQISADFNKLSTKEKNALWIEKMDQLLAQNLPKDHQILTGKVREILLKNSDLDQSAGVVETALGLATITPEDDFIRMYSSLYDYTYDGKFSGKEKVSEFILNDLSKLGSDPTGGGDGEANRDCNCRWTCDLWNRNAPSNDKGPADYYQSESRAGGCRITADGCGFLWMSECTGYIGF